jgi:glyoxylase-like metal-dependent hydrolase (beta-lactamase superfamily II)
LRPLADGAEVFGLQVVATPGHTAGHICVFDPESGVLVAGDALTNAGALNGSNPQFTEDPAAAAESVRALAALPVRTVLFGHGEPLESGAAAALARLAAG